MEVEIGGVAIYRPFGEFRRAKSYCHLCRSPKWEANTRHGVSFVPTLLKTLEEDLKQQPVYQDNPKDAQSDLSLEIKLAIPFVQNEDR
ncbi:hypothetical protein TNCV_3927251 [Trichonephila clavipes]|nr:hypothetical protein TNCV_3927251 [Trichonephila clavipes]